MNPQEILLALSDRFPNRYIPDLLREVGKYILRSESTQTGLDLTHLRRCGQYLFWDTCVVEVRSFLQQRLPPRPNIYNGPLPLRRVVDPHNLQDLDALRALMANFRWLADPARQRPEAPRPDVNAPQG